MFIVKRKCQARDWPNFRDGSEIDATLGVVENKEDGLKLLVILQHKINNDPTVSIDEDFGEFTAEINETDRELPYLVVWSEDVDMVWFTVELEPVVLLDRETIENRLTEAIGG